MSAWHPACPTGCFLDQMLHSNVWRRLRQKLTALPCPCCVCLHRAMFFYVFLSQSHSSNSTRAANDVPWYIMYHHISPYYIMIFPNSSDARSWQLISFLNFQDGRGNKLPMWGHCGVSWGDFPKMEKSWARWDMIMSDWSAGLECRFLLQFIDMWAMYFTSFLQWISL